jgi:hypothetical protein
VVASRTIARSMSARTPSRSKPMRSAIERSGVVLQTAVKSIELLEIQRYA